MHLYFNFPCSWIERSSPPMYLSDLSHPPRPPPPPSLFFPSPPPSQYITIVSHPLACSIFISSSPISHLPLRSTPTHFKIFSLIYSGTAASSPVASPVPSPAASHDVLPSSNTMGFDFERMTASFELIQSEFEASNHALPPTSLFVSAMSEVLKLFETLGSAFTFVKRDIHSKISIISRYHASNPAQYSDLTAAVLHELETSTTRRAPGTPPSCSRTLLRLMWALNFADGLLDGLALAFDPASDVSTSDRTLKWAVSRSYDASLAEHHSWTIRRAVKSACLLLPTKESFFDRLGVERKSRDAFLSRLAVSMSPLVKRMYAFYGQHDLLSLP